MMRRTITIAPSLMLIVICTLILAQYISRQSYWSKAYDEAQKAWTSNYAEDWKLDIFQVPEGDFSKLTPFADSWHDNDDDIAEEDADDIEEKATPLDAISAADNESRVTTRLIASPTTAESGDSERELDVDAKRLVESASGTQQVEASTTMAAEIPATTNDSEPALTRGSPELVSKAADVVKAIVSPEDNELVKLICGEPNVTRYAYLKPSDSTGADTKPRYVFALDLHQAIEIIPRLLSSIVHAIRFLGPSNCALSIVEGRSMDGTYETLSALKHELHELGVQYHLQTTSLHPNEENADRIARLAELRNLALSPLTQHPGNFSPDATVIFSNDVALCVNDILELLHQRIYQKADMMCAMDWIEHGYNFYDVWISRQMNGDSVFEIPQDGSWGFAGNVFWNEPPARERWRGERRCRCSRVGMAWRFSRRNPWCKGVWGLGLAGRKRGSVIWGNLRCFVWICGRGLGEDGSRDDC